MKTPRLSILDLAPVLKGKSLQDTFENSVTLIRKAEELGFMRYWLAEHHNMASIASSAPPILIGYLAGKTNRIRVGSGGVMLPNHSSLVVAEQFGTLDALYPGRIDLGVGRAPGTDSVTAQALGRNPYTINEGFPQQIREVQRLFSKNPSSPVRAIPGEGSEIPVYILGSSTDSAYLAAELGLPYAFAGHFAPAQLKEAFRIYRERFTPSAQLQQPYTLAAVNTVLADTDEEAQLLATTIYQAFTNILRDTRQPFGPPDANWQPDWTPQEKAHLSYMLALTFIGTPDQVKPQLDAFIEDYQPDELIAVSHIYSLEAKLRSYELLAELLKAE
ncbi:MAG: LLM class flavin-dependent oxidoreductase [Sphingobacteriales bacterium]|nr:MAG: LLM class flavin-dependent oxidoreductase [Sphingobacteriales bacterium]